MTYLILGEFNRTILETIRKLLNTFLKNEDIINNFESIDIFINDVIKDIYFFSNQEASRIIKLIPYLRKEIELKVEKYQKFDIGLKYPIQKIIDDANVYRLTFLKEFKILKESYECQNIIRRLTFNHKEHRVSFEKPYCSLCEKKILEYFKRNYICEIKLFQNNITSLTLRYRQDEKEKLVKSLTFLLEFDNGIKLDGRHHICWNLIDIFLVLEAPKNSVILTTNMRHQGPFAKCIYKQISDLS
ncbi:MAG: hypothetical protein CEE43_14020 [Promethearchaeota archaeon Loki_b32]|nr:MAG: hypothetical protein CEE43_14020 [Candidatus Lokiarchaeota archaeon Loki_b32]